MSARTILAAAVLIAAPAAARDIPIAERDIFPESISADASGRLYFGSLKGIVFRTDAKRTKAEPWIRPDAKNGLLALLGVVADSARRTLWVCSSPFSIRVPPATGTSALVAFDLTSGRLKGRYELPPPASACNDIAIDAKGVVYATDTPNGRIFALAPGAKALALFAEDAAMKGLDGIAFAGDGTLYTNNVRTGAMQRVARTPDGRFDRFVPLTTSQPLAGPDGLRLLSGNRFLQAESMAPGGKISEVTIDNDAATVRTIWQGPNSVPGVTPGPDAIYAVEGKIGYLFDPKLKGQDPNPFVVRAISPAPAK